MASGWHRTDDDWVQHPKTIALQELLNEPLADAYVSRLWAWTSRFRVRGRFAQDVVRHLEMMCGWRGEHGELLEAFITVGWIDRRGADTFELHDWWEKQGPLVEKAEKDAARKRSARRKSRQRESADDAADASADAPRDGAGTDGRYGRDETTRDVVAPPSAPPIAIAITAPTTPRETWLGDDFWRWAQSVRNAGGYVAEKPPRNLGAWWSAVLSALNGDVDRACEAFEEFGQDKHWEVRNFPFAAFQSQWEKYTPRRAS